jgi:hypothetical protein
MTTSRIVLALVLAGVAAPALGEKCHHCNFEDEPIIVMGGNQARNTGQPVAPGSLPAGTATPEQPFLGRIMQGAKRSPGAQPAPRPTPSPAPPAGHAIRR